MNNLHIPRSVSGLLGEAVKTGSELSLSVDESWMQGRSWFGGLQIALALKAARQVTSSDVPIRSIQGIFLAPVAQDEPAMASASALRAGRSVTQVRADVRQGDRSCFQCTAIFGTARDSSVRVDSARPSTADPERSTRLPFRPGITPNFTQHYELGWTRGEPPFSGAPDAQATILVRPRADNAIYDESEILAITDVIPPPVIALMDSPSPVSTMNCGLELIRPELVYGTRQWLRFEVALHDAHSGYTWQSAHIYSESGILLAISHQSVAVFG